MRTTLSILAALAISGAAGAYAADQTLPVSPSPETPMAKPDTVTAQTVNDVLIATADTTSFARLAKAAGQDATLTTSGPYTVFAPTNAAFEQLPPGKAEQLLQPGNKKEAEMMVNYHIVAGKILSSDIPMGETKVPTLNGGTIVLKKTADGVWVDGAQVTVADITAGNGVIHEINGVISPAATN